MMKYWSEKFGVMDRDQGFMAKNNVELGLLFLGSFLFA